MRNDPKVRAAVAKDPRLSVVRIHELLGEPDTAGSAVVNPALPVGTMTQIINDAEAEVS